MICNWQYIPLIYYLYIAYWVIIDHLPPIKGTRNSYWKMADVSCFYFCAEFVFFLYPFEKNLGEKKKQTQPAPWEDFDQKLHAGKSRAPLRNTYLRFAYSMLGNSTTHFLLNGGHCWWWFIMAQSLNNHLWTKQIQVITKTKLQMGHLNSIFFWLFFQRIKMF